MPEHHSTSRRSVALDDPPDQEVIRRVRAGDTAAYGVIYRRHHEAVHRLARRFAKHASEADDVTSEVFAKTLRAIVHGHGPTDDAGPYLLRSVRNTVTSLRVGGDARIIPTDDDQLDRPGPQAASRYDDDDVSLAFLDLPDRYRDVLWATVVEGRGPADIADGAIDAGAVASLTHRARFALRRSYLISSTRRRCAVDTCREIRQLMPGAVLGQAAISTCGRIDDHALGCSECTDVRDDMERLAQQMPARSLLGVLGAWWARLGSTAAQLAGSAAPIVAPALVATVGVATTMMAASSHEIDRPAVTAGPAIELAEPFGVIGSDAAALEPGGLDGVDAPPSPITATVEEPIEADAVSGPSEPSGALDAAPSPTGAKTGHHAIPRDATVGIGGVAPSGIATSGAQAADPSDLDGSTLDELTGTLLPGDPADPLAGLAGTVGGAVDDLVGSGGVGIVDGAVDGAVGGVVGGAVDDVVKPVLAGTGQVVGAVGGAVDEIVTTTLDEVTTIIDTTLHTVDDVVAPVVGGLGSKLGGVTGGGGTSTGPQPAPVPTMPVAPLLDDVVTATESVTGSTGDTVETVSRSLTGLLGR